MSPTSTALRAQREVKASEPRLNGLIGAVRNTQATLKDVEGGEWLLGCAERALERVMSRKEAALTMGMDAGQMTNQFKGVGHLSMRRIGLMPEAFFLALIDELREHFQIDNDADRLARALKARAACDEVINEIARKGAQR